MNSPNLDTSPVETELLAAGLLPGDRHYRAFVGPPERYDLAAAMQFNLLTHVGLREQHTLLDIGCGSLRFGRLAIPYLRPGRYYGLEPEQWLVEEGIENECGRDLIHIKRATFAYRDDFALTSFGVTFDYLMAQSIFSHAAKSQIRKCLTEAAACMHPESLLLATYQPGAPDYEGDQWLYPQCCTYCEATLRQIARQCRLSCEPVDWQHPNGQKWLLFRTDRATPGSQSEHTSVPS